MAKELDKDKFVEVKWRVGRKVGRTVYAQVSTSASNSDLLIGVFDTKELAKEAVKAHNDKLKR